MPILRDKDSFQNPSKGADPRMCGRIVAITAKPRAAGPRWLIRTVATLMAIGLGLFSAATPPGPTPQQETVIEKWTLGLSAETLAEKIGCLECHGPHNDLGPSFRDIATRYRDDDRAREHLLRIVKQGGKGNWTAVSRGMPMPRYGERLSESQIRRLVDWILER